jgi:hypothetical protein
MYTKSKRKNITKRKNKRKFIGKKGGKSKKKINKEVLNNARKLFGSI